MYKVLIAITIALAVSGCAVKKNYGASGGSKADGIVKMSYTYTSFEIPEVNNNQALQQAIRRCQIWGYSSAESFDFTNKACQQSDAYGGCTLWLVTKEFQCNG